MRKTTVNNFYGVGAMSQSVSAFCANTGTWVWVVRAHLQSQGKELKQTLGGCWPVRLAEQ